MEFQKFVGNILLGLKISRLMRLKIGTNKDVTSRLTRMPSGLTDKFEMKLTNWDEFLRMLEKYFAN